MMVDIVRPLIGMLPFEVSLGGRKRKFIAAGLDPIFAKSIPATIQTAYGHLHLACEHPPERLMAYCFDNIMRSYERSPLGRHIRSVSRRGTSFIDVGANLGVYSLIARAAGADSYLVEPEPAHSAFLSRNSATFGQVIAAAMSNGERSLPLYYSRTNSGATSLIARDDFVASDQTVPVTSFARLSGDGRLGDPARIALVKIDVEGFEIEAVEGMLPFFDQGHRPDIWCEVRGARSNRRPNSFRAVRDALVGVGYAAFDGDALDARQVPAPADAVLEERHVFDLLFLERGASRA